MYIRFKINVTARLIMLRLHTEWQAAGTCPLATAGCPNGPTKWGWLLPRLLLRMLNSWCT